MGIREALTTSEGEPFYRSPRTLAQWGGEWALIGSARLLELSHTLFLAAGRTDRARYVTRLAAACAEIEAEEKTAEETAAERRATEQYIRENWEPGLRGDAPEMAS
jgi:hypothetical protein